MYSGVEQARQSTPTDAIQDLKINVSIRRRLIWPMTGQQAMCHYWPAYSAEGPVLFCSQCVCRRRLSSVVVCNTPRRNVTYQEAVRGGPVVLRPVRTTHCFNLNNVKRITRTEDYGAVDQRILAVLWTRLVSRAGSVTIIQRIRGFAFMRYIYPRLTLTLTLSTINKIVLAVKPHKPQTNESTK